MTLQGIEVGVLDARRKVLELVCFLVTRPEMSATRDEVVDAVWPNSDPSSAANSLNQTIYFLRRVFEPGYNERLSPGYVRNESDVVWLDVELVVSRSRRCRAIIAKLGAADNELDVVELATQYRGKFALDFAYAEWAGDYRDTLHAGYLEAMEKAIALRLRIGRTGEAISLARGALEIDASADHIERLLIRGYHSARAHAAVREQYAHYAAAMQTALGVDAPTLAELIADDFQSLADT